MIWDKTSDIKRCQVAWPRDVMLCSRHLDFVVEFSLLSNTSELVHPAVSFLDDCLKNPLSVSAILQWTSISCRAKVPTTFFRYNEVSLYRGSFPYISLLLG